METKRTPTGMELMMKDAPTIGMTATKKAEQALREFEAQRGMPLSERERFVYQFAYIAGMTAVVQNQLADNIAAMNGIIPATIGATGDSMRVNEGNEGVTK